MHTTLARTLVSALTALALLSPVSAFAQHGAQPGGPPPPGGTRPTRPTTASPTQPGQPQPQAPAQTPQPTTPSSAQPSNQAGQPGAQPQPTTQQTTQPGQPQPRGVQMLAPPQQQPPAPTSPPPETKPAAPVKLPTLAELKKLNARLAPVDLTADVSKLPPNERRALAKMVEAAKIMDPLFLRQVWSGNETLLIDLLNDSSPLGKARLDAFLLHKGPWDRLEHNNPFIPGVPPKPAQGNFFTANDKSEVERWVATLKEPQKTDATGFFTTIRKDEKGNFVIVPYSLEYQGELSRAAQLLREAAQLTQQPTLKKFLEARAEAFLSNDYYASDVAWMQLDASVEPTIGPYEVYEDEWFNQKAAFEAFITLRDDAETAKLQRLASELQELEDHLPIDARFRNPKLGALAPIRVVNSIYCSGDGNRGVQTAAYNLPNDERIAKEMGTKRVMLRNVQQAKFKTVLIPIAKVALAPADQKNVDFDAFFTYILMHELMHGLGPHNVTVNGQQTTVRQAFQDTYSAIEEAKADVSGMWALGYLTDKGVLDKKFAKTMYVTYLASAFRSIRFGVAEAHGRGTALQLNYLLDKGAFVVKPNGTFAVDDKKIREGITELAHDLLTWEALGDRMGAKQALEQLGVVRPEVAKVLKKLDKVPVDIKPRFVTADKVLSEAVGQK